MELGILLPARLVTELRDDEVARAAEVRGGEHVMLLLRHGACDAPTGERTNAGVAIANDESLRQPIWHFLDGIFKAAAHLASIA